MAPTAGRIVVLIARFFNCDRLEVGICPGVELVAIECNTLFSNADFSQVRPDCVLEFFSAHTEVCGSLHCSDEAGRKTLLLKTVNIAGILNRQKPSPDAGAAIDELDGELAAAEREAQAIIERMQKSGNVH